VHPRAAGARFYRENLLELDPVTPVVTEVVDVEERRAWSGDVPQPGTPLVYGWVAPAVAVVVGPVPRAVGLELMKVAVPPAEGGLQDLVEVGHPDVLGDEEPAPHRWLRPEDRGLQLVDVLAHRSSFPRSETRL